jgi:hypothetical protein
VTPLSQRLAANPSLRPLVALARAVWRPIFAFRCGWAGYRSLQERARLVLESPDCRRLTRAPHAGRIRGFTQVMHNGLRVRLGSYYGFGCVPFFRRTGGIHEPQEEIAFAAILPLVPPGAVMLELGSYWAFYSMWFAQCVPGARNFLVEPDPACLKTGRAHFALNGFTGHFTQALVGRTSAPGNAGIPLLDVDSFCATHHLERLHLLHADIQGYELEMLEGTRRMLAENRVDFLFLSTHGEPLHRACRDQLATQTTMQLVVDVPPAASYSADGLLVAARAGLPVPPITVALRGAATSCTS